MLVDDFADIMARGGGLLAGGTEPPGDGELSASLRRLETAARAVAPILRLHPDDRYRPAPIEFFLPRVELGIWDRPSGSFDRVLGQVYVGKISIDVLLTQERLGQRSASPVLGARRRSDWRVYINQARKPSRMPSAAWEKFCEETRLGLMDGAPCYVHLRRPVDDSDALDIQYWFFYPYNGVMGSPPFTAEHEGDWEHVTVRISDDGNPIKVYYSAHDGEGSWYRLGQGSPVTLLDGAHPVVYSAYHSHASYPTAGIIRRATAIADLPDDKTSDAGPLIRTAERLQLIAIGDVVVRGRSWVHFSGSWGRLASPYGPAFQASWYVEPDVRRL